jgi:hypothetical protein
LRPFFGAFFSVYTTMFQPENIRFCTTNERKINGMKSSIECGPFCHIPAAKLPRADDIDESKFNREADPDIISAIKTIVCPANGLNIATDIINYRLDPQSGEIIESFQKYPPGTTKFDIYEDLRIRYVHTNHQLLPNMFKTGKAVYLYDCNCGISGELEFVFFHKPFTEKYISEYVEKTPLDTLLGISGGFQWADHLDYIQVMNGVNRGDNGFTIELSYFSQNILGAFPDFYSMTKQLENFAISRRVGNLTWDINQRVKNLQLPIYDTGFWEESLDNNFYCKLQNRGFVMT